MKKMTMLVDVEREFRLIENQIDRLASAPTRDLQREFHNLELVANNALATVLFVRTELGSLAGRLPPVQKIAHHRL